MFVKMHRIITQKTCHLFSATLLEWLWVSQLIIRGRIDSSESQNEPLWCEEISLTVFGWAVFTLQWGGVGTLHHSPVNRGSVHTLNRCLWMGEKEAGCDIWSSDWKIFSCDQTFHEIINALFHSAGSCHMISRGYGSDFQAAKNKVLCTVLSKCVN